MIAPIGREIPLYSPAVEYHSKHKFTKWILGAFCTNYGQRNKQKLNNLCKNTKTIIRLRLGDFRVILTSTLSQ